MQQNSVWVCLLKTSARVSILRVEIENETSQGNFGESRMRMRVLRGENEIEIKVETPNLLEWGSD